MTKSILTVVAVLAVITFSGCENGFSVEPSNNQQQETIKQANNLGFEGVTMNEVCEQAEQALAGDEDTAEYKFANENCLNYEFK